MNSATTLRHKTVGARLVPAQSEAVAIASPSLLVMLSRRRRISHPLRASSACQSPGIAEPVPSRSPEHSEVATEESRRVCFGNACLAITVNGC